MYATITFLLTLLPAAVLGAEVKFSYDLDAEDGPLNWGELEIENNQCGGMSQSGINIPTGACDEVMADYVFTEGTCTTSDLTFKINDHVVQLSFDTTISNCTPPSMVIPGTDTIFDVLQYHIHAGSDHTLDNQHFGADMHIVHKNRNGDDLAVLGMFLEPSSIDATSVFDVLIAGLEAVEEETAAICGKNVTMNSTDVEVQAAGNRRSRRQLQGVYNPYAHIPSNSTMYYYSGSLTTPPCSEIVSWNVIDTPISLSIVEYTDIIDAIFGYTDPTSCEKSSVFSPSGFTSRPVQPLNGRKITHFCPTGTESNFDVPGAAPTVSTSAAATTGFMTTMAFVITTITVSMF